jgi:hypothetical protein
MDQGRTRVFGEAYSLYAAAGNPRRTQIRAKRAIYGWKLDSSALIVNEASRIRSVTQWELNPHRGQVEQANIILKSLDCQ